MYDPETRLEQSSIGLKYKLRPGSGAYSSSSSSNFLSAELRIKCVSRIGNAYWQSVDEVTTVKRTGRMLESRSNGPGGERMNTQIINN